MSELVEFFCGIGGVSEAIRQFNAARPPELRLHVPRAIDIDRGCAEVYEHNFGTRVECRSIESMNLQDVADTQARQVWWLSPPCQPYCRRGRGAPGTDRRCDAIHAITRFLARSESLPKGLLLENVPEFAPSRDAAKLTSVLHERGYATWSGDLCPTQFGIPNLRRRHYLVAQLDAAEIRPPALRPRRDRWNFTVSSILESDAQSRSDLLVDARIVDAYESAMDLIDVSDESARAACFGSGYGKSIIRSGSYLRLVDRVRRFSPEEALRLLGFSSEFTFPTGMSTRRRWKMLGNSLSVTVVHAVLETAVDPVSLSGT